MTESEDGKETVVELPVRAAARITVGLIPKAAADLVDVAADSGLSKTDVINRGVQSYAFLHFKQADGAEILIRERDGTVTKLVLI